MVPQVVEAAEGESILARCQTALKANPSSATVSIEQVIVLLMKCLGTRVDAIWARRAATLTNPDPSRSKLDKVCVRDGHCGPFVLDR
jgi:hypothetical protein